MAHDPPQWSFQCRDAVGRPGTMTVTVRDGELVVTAPVGEVAVFRHDHIAEAERLRLTVVRALERLRERSSRPGGS